MEQTTTNPLTNEQIIEEFFIHCDKDTYLEFLREMFDAYVTSAGYLQLANPINQKNAVFYYRQIEKLIESIN